MARTPLVIRPGSRLPPGATPTVDGVNFATFSPCATRVELLLYEAADSPEPFQVIDLEGLAGLRDGKVEVSDTEVDSPSGKFQLSGTATIDREVALRMTSLPGTTARGGYAISGTLEAPLVTPLAQNEQAILKSPPGK